MIRLNDPIPVLPDMAQGYAVRPINIDDLNSYTETFSTAFDETPPFGELVQNSLPKGFLCVEYLPTGTVVASASAAIYKISQHPNGHSLQWVVAHSEHRGKGIGHGLLHGNHHQVVLGMKPVVGAGRSTPAEFTCFTCGVPVLACLHANRKTEPETDPGPDVSDPDGHELAGELVGGHQANRFCGQEALAVKFSAICDHLKKPEIVAGRRDQPSSAR